MKQIIREQSSGKTRELMEYAKMHNAIFVCENAYAMKIKAQNYGIIGLEILGYYDFYCKYLEGVKPFHHLPDFVIDNLENFVIFNLIGYNKEHFLGYTLNLNNEE